jgi:hypothetical protein
MIGAISLYQHEAGYENSWDQQLKRMRCRPKKLTSLSTGMREASLKPPQP